MLSLLLCTLGDRPEEIARLYRSLQGQKNQNFEIILVTQGNHEAMRGLIGGFPFSYRHIATEIKGLSRGRNLALEAAQGEYFTLTDDDCWYPEDALRIAAERLGATDAAAVDFMMYDPDQKRYDRAYPSESIHALSKRNTLSIISSELFFRREAVGETRFDERFGVGSLYNSGEENIFLSDLRKKGLRVEFQPEIIAYHPAKSRTQYLNALGVASKAAVFKRLFGGSLGLALFVAYYAKNREIIQFRDFAAAVKKYAEIKL